MWRARTASSKTGCWMWTYRASSTTWIGDCWDNAPTESLWGRLKVGRLYGQNFATRRQAMDEVIDWMAFYNHSRLHSSLGYVSPRQYEERWIAAQLNKAA